jgi:hypothetical protein
MLQNLEQLKVFELHKLSKMLPKLEQLKVSELLAQQSLKDMVPKAQDSLDGKQDTQLKMKCGYRNVDAVASLRCS